MTTLGVELPDGSVLFGKPWSQFMARAYWLGGLTPGEYERIMEDADHGD